MSKFTNGERNLLNPDITVDEWSVRIYGSLSITFEEILLLEMKYFLGLKYSQRVASWTFHFTCYLH